MKTLGPVVALAVCAAAFIARPARAAVPEEAHVRVPFSFVVGDQTLPAGRYTITTDETTPSVLFFRSADRLHTAIIDTEWGSSKVTEMPRLVFSVYGTTHFLSGVNMADESLRAISLTPDEVTMELARLDRDRAMANGE